MSFRRKVKLSRIAVARKIIAKCSIDFGTHVFDLTDFNSTFIILKDGSLVQI